MKLRELVSHINWFRVSIYTVLLVVIGSFMFKFIETHHYNNSAWTVSSSNYGFVLVVNNENEQYVVRNPIPGLVPGDQVIVRGFTVTGSELPYILSKRF